MELKAVNTDEQVIAVKPKLDQVVKASKELLEFPAHPDLVIPPPTKPLDQMNRVERCRSVFDELLIELVSKVGLLCAGIQGTKNYNKIVESGKLCKSLRVLLIDFPDSEMSINPASLALPVSLKGTLSRALAKKHEAQVLKALQGPSHRTFCNYDELGTLPGAGAIPGLLAVPTSGWKVEVGTPDLAEYLPRPLLLIEPVMITRYYLDLFCGRDHVNYVAKAPDTKDAPCVLSVKVQKKNDDYLCTVLARRKKGISILQFTENSRREIRHTDAIRSFVKRCRPDFDNYAFAPIKEASIEHSLYEFENKLVISRLKFGIIFAKQGQGSNETDMYINDAGSWEFDEFLNCLGKKIKLEGWKKYRGGLDLALPGAQSVYTDFRGLEIMFHVSTMLPQTSTGQPVERKRHIGNDIVVIIFQNGDTPFSAGCIKSNFNQVFVIVSPDRSKMTPEKKLVFKVCVVMHEDVKLFGPRIPREYAFEPNEYFREWMLTKLVNAELECLRDSAHFSYAAADTRKNMLKDLAASLA